MLTEQTVGYVYDLAEQLNAAGTRIQVIANTPLANVVAESSPSFGTAFSQKIQNNAKEVVVSTITGVTRNADIMSPHTAAVSALSTQLAENVTRHISVARSIVSPIVQNYASDVIKAIEAYRHLDPAEGFKIDKVYIPEPLLTESLLADLVPHREARVVDLRDSIRIGGVSDEDLVANLFTGSASVDNAIKEWVSSFDVSILRKTWDRYFLSGTIDSNLIYSGEYSEILNSALALYLYTRRLMNNPVAVEGMTTLVYNTKLSVLEQYAGALVCNYLREMEYACRVERLVMEFVPSYKRMVVCGTVFDKYMQEGGSVDVLMGMLTEGISATSLQGVKEISEKALAGWNRYITLSNYQAKKNRAEILRVAYRNTFVNAFADLDVFEKEYNDAHPGHADVAIKRMRDYLDSLTEEQLENVNSISMKLIADFRFSYTQAYQILCDIEAALQANKDLDPREAATIALINLVTDYVSAQLQRV